MDSLVYGKIVIGPNTGAFYDLATEGLIYIYNDFNELVELFDDHLKNPRADLKKLKSFIIENSWENFGKKIYDYIE